MSRQKLAPRTCCNELQFTSLPVTPLYSVLSHFQLLLYPPRALLFNIPWTTSCSSTQNVDFIIIELSSDHSLLTMAVVWRAGVEMRALSRPLTWAEKSNDLSHHCYNPVCTLAGSWSQEPGLRTESTCFNVGYKNLNCLAKCLFLTNISI